MFQKLPAFLKKNCQSDSLKNKQKVPSMVAFAVIDEKINKFNIEDIFETRKQAEQFMKFAKEIFNRNHYIVEIKIQQRD